MTVHAKTPGAPGDGFDFSSISEVQLAHGSHKSAEEGLCFMEMVAWFAGEKHSDKPECACPVLGRYGIAINDQAPADFRDRALKPLVPMIAGTRGTWQDQGARAQFLAMWHVNKIAPIYLRTLAEFLPASHRGALDALASQCEVAHTPTDLREIEQRALAARAARADLAALAARADLADLADLAARAARARGQILELMVEGLRQAILIGPHEGFDVIIDLRARHQALRELVNA